MADQPEPPFKVSRSAAIFQQLRQWGERAKALGIASEYAAALRAIEEGLTRDPLDWGDPLYRVGSLHVVVCSRIFWNIKILYAVHEEKRLVFLISYELVLHNPLLPRDDKLSGNGRV